jgi:Helix-turn-helix domain
MGTAIAVRTGFSSQKLRRLATRVKDAAQARRLLAIAAVLDSAAREEAAKIGGMDRQTLRDWVVRFNDQGPDGLIILCMDSKNSPCPELVAACFTFVAARVLGCSISALTWQSRKTSILRSWRVA